MERAMSKQKVSFLNINTGTAIRKGSLSICVYSDWLRNKIIPRLISAAVILSLWIPSRDQY